MKRLAIAIPTYNRVDIIKENLDEMLEEIIKHNLNVYISDDSSNTHTFELIQNLKKIYPNFIYEHNYPSLGHDGNCYKTLSMPNEDYIWYLGDSMCINKGDITKLVLELEQSSIDIDFYITNASNRNINLPTKLYYDTKEVLNDIAWHLTLTGCCIYKRDKIILKKNIVKNFPQTQLVLEQIVRDCKLKFLHDVMIHPNSSKGSSYWCNTVFDVFGTDWANLIDSTQGSNLTFTERNRIIKSHSLKTGIFGYKNMLKMRMNGNYDLEFYLKNRNLVNLVSHLNTIQLIIIAMLPVSLLKLIRKI